MDGRDQPPVDGATTPPKAAASYGSDDTWKAEASSVPASSEGVISTMNGGDQPPVDGASTPSEAAASCGSEDTGKTEATSVPASSEGVRSTMDGGDQPPVDGASTPSEAAASCGSEHTGKTEATSVPACSEGVRSTMDGGDQPPVDGASTPLEAAASFGSEDTGKAEATPVLASSESVGSSCGGSESCDALAKAMSATLGVVMRELDSRGEGAARSQDELADSIDRLTGELDKLLEDAPLPFIMQHAAKISSIHKRVSGLNLLLKSVQRRVDNIDRMLSTGIPIDKAPPDIVETSSLTL